MIAELPYYCIRNLTDPCQRELNISHHEAKVRLHALSPISTKRNLREYLAEHGRKSAVHKDIENTLRNQPNLFSTLNGGVTICARHADGFSSKEGVLKLTDPSIINGAQTKGSVESYFEELAAELEAMGPDGDLNDLNGPEELESFVSAHIFIIDDRDLEGELTISLNNQNNVKMISKMNARGELNDMAAAFSKAGMKIRLTESDPPNNGLVDTEKLLKVIEALTPEELWTTFFNRRSTQLQPKKWVMVKSSAYSTKARVLKDFGILYDAAMDPEHPKHEEARTHYQYYVDIGPSAWQLYMKWKMHQGFASSKIRGPIKRSSRKGRPPLTKDDEGNIVEVVDGLIFPCIATLSEFVKMKKGKWTISRIPKWVDEVLIDAILHFYRQKAKSTAHTCGRTHQCYADLAMAMSYARKFGRAEEQDAR
jgi:hypothetical protein